MFIPDFYPTPDNIIKMMLEGENVTDRIILEPSAGKGNIIDELKLRGTKDILMCETDKHLQKVLAGKGTFLKPDFLQVESHEISHVDYIIMNPPFSADEKHILHAYNIAPAGCKIVALCNLNTVQNRYTNSRKELGSLIEQFGSFEDVGQAFTQSERKTGVEIALIRLQKPGANYSTEFDGFFMDGDAPEEQENGLMSYNVVRDLVNRYVAAIKLYDQQLELAAKMNDLTHAYFFSGKPELTMNVNRLQVPVCRNEFKKEMQKSGWKWIFDKMDLTKFTTRGLREDINKFVEKQQDIPFTMKNIYAMLEIVIGTTGQRMDKAMLEVFDRVTSRCNDNKMQVEGWKTNLHYLVNKRFILPYCFESGWSRGLQYKDWREDGELMSDFEKALCYLTGENYDEIKTLRQSIDYVQPNEWNDSHFFKIKGFKKGTGHVEFKDEEVWGKFNQRIAKLKGYPLYEYKKPSVRQEQQRKKTDYTTTATKCSPIILGTFKINKTEAA
jgi:hypothetical protein